MHLLARCLLIEVFVFRHVIPSLSRHAADNSLRTTEALKDLERIVKSPESPIPRDLLNVQLLWTLFKLRGVRNLVAHGFVLVPVDGIAEPIITSVSSTDKAQESSCMATFVRDSGGFLYRAATSELALEPKLDLAIDECLRRLFEFDIFTRPSQELLELPPLPSCGELDDVFGVISYHDALQRIYSRFKGEEATASGPVDGGPQQSRLGPVLEMLRELWQIEHLCRCACAARGLYDGLYLVTARQVLSDLPAAKKGRLWVDSDLSSVLRLSPDAYDLAIDVFLHPQGLRIHELVFHDPICLLFSLSPGEMEILAELVAALKEAVEVAAGKRYHTRSFRYSSYCSTASRTLAGLSSCARLMPSKPPQEQSIPLRIASIRDACSARACVCLSALVQELEAESHRGSIDDILAVLPLELVHTFLYTEYMETYVNGHHDRPDIFGPVARAAQAALCALRAGPRDKAIRKCTDLRSRLYTVSSKLARLGGVANRVGN